MKHSDSHMGWASLVLKALCYAVPVLLRCLLCQVLDGPDKAYRSGSDVCIPKPVCCCKCMNLLWRVVAFQCAQMSFAFWRDGSYTASDAGKHRV